MNMMKVLVGNSTLIITEQFKKTGQVKRMKEASLTWGWDTPCVKHARNCMALRSDRRHEFHRGILQCNTEVQSWDEECLVFAKLVRKPTTIRCLISIQFGQLRADTKPFKRRGSVNHKQISPSYPFPSTFFKPWHWKPICGLFPR